MDEIARLRSEYKKGALDEEHADADPIRPVHALVGRSDAARSCPKPNAMTLATADRNGAPSARVVLLKGYDEHGFVFFTNYQSRKGRELAANPRAALLFFWVELERQVRIEGCVDQIAATESDEYYRSRPLASRIGAWASPQSEPITGKALADGARSGNGTEPRPAIRNARLTGAVTGCVRSPWSSGRVGLRGCTIGCATPDPRRAGSASG